MTSLDVAPATSSPVPHTDNVARRESLWKGGPVEVRVPDTCREGTFQDLVFIQFALKVNGGLVNVFVHGDNPSQHIGKTIVAEAEVLRKDMKDGRSFVYVDLRPTTDKHSHELWVSYAPLQTKQTVVFRTPALKGEVAIVQLPAQSIGDKQLDRLVSQGWVIQQEDANTVYLAKGERTLKHNKPKKKANSS